MSLTDPTHRIISGRVAEHMDRLFRELDDGDTRINRDEFANGIVIGETRTAGCVVKLDASIDEHRYVVMHNSDDEGGPHVIVAMLMDNDLAHLFWEFDGDITIVPV